MKSHYPLWVRAGGICVGWGGVLQETRQLYYISSPLGFCNPHPFSVLSLGYLRIPIDKTGFFNLIHMIGSISLAGRTVNAICVIPGLFPPSTSPLPCIITQWWQDRAPQVICLYFKRKAFWLVSCIFRSLWFLIVERKWCSRKHRWKGSTQKEPDGRMWSAGRGFGNPWLRKSVGTCTNYFRTTFSLFFSSPP